MKRLTAWFLLIGMILGMLPLQTRAAENSKPVERIELSQTKLEMAVGEIAELEMKLYPEDSGDGGWIWRSSDVSVVKLIGSGLLEAVGEGAAEITLEADGQKAVCQVTVSGFALRGFSLRSNSVVSVPKGIVPSFYQPGDNQTLGDAIEAEAGTEQNGMIPYRIAAEPGREITVRGTDAEGNSWGGMTLTIPESGEVSVRNVMCKIRNFAGSDLTGTVEVHYDQDAQTAEPGDGGRFLLAAGETYTYSTNLPETIQEDYKNASKTETLNSGAEMLEQILVPQLRFCKSITAPSDAKVQVFGRRNGSTYYVYDEYLPKYFRDNGDGTRTWQFSVYQKEGSNRKKISDINWRVTMGDVVKAGYWADNQSELTVTRNQKPENQNTSFTENSVLLNVNGQNTLHLAPGGTYELRAYRAWEIINSHSGNSVIMPEFHFEIITGSDVVKLEPIQAPVNGSSCWQKLTALKTGVAVIEVSYDAIDIFGSGNLDGTYAASDPTRTGLLVVNVGGGITADFGIECFASIGTKGSANITYDSDSKRSWDAEFDTLYFTGEEGYLKLNPKTAGTLEISHNKGRSYEEIKPENGCYRASIKPGNNILRLTTNSGVAHQVVRGERIETVVTEIENNGSRQNVIEAGDKVRISLNGLHQPFPKMAGIYNPGFGENTDGYSQVHLNYSLDGKTVYGPGRQYDFITQANYLDVTVPENTEDTVSLTGGYIGLGVYGKNNADILQNANNHRGMEAPTVNTNASTTFHTRSILPDITITLGTETKNLPPKILGNAPSKASVTAGKNFQIVLTSIFQDPEGKALEYWVSVNGGKRQYIDDATYLYTTQTPGTVKLTFRAMDDADQFSQEHTITLTVTEASEDSGSGGNQDSGNSNNNSTNSGSGSSTSGSSGSNNSSNKLEFGLAQSEIAGYVTISFEDKGVRLPEEQSSPTMHYPRALGTILAGTKVPFKKGETIAQVTLRLLDHKKIGYSYTGSPTSNFYLQAIKNFEVNNTEYASMGEFDAGQGSGWMITWNKVFINRGASDFKVSNGDTIRWQYTCQYGKDIGDPFYGDDQASTQSGTQNQTTGTDQTDETDQKKADAVKKLIQDLPDSITIAQETQVKQASDAYDALTSNQKKLLSNTLTEKLKKAKQKIGALKTTDSEKQAAQAVEKLIDAIGTPVTLEKEADIRKARNAYQALSDAQKYLIGNYDQLTAAEEALAQLQKTVTAEEACRITGDYLEKLGTPGVGSVGGEWMVLGLKRAGRNLADENSYYQTVEQYVRENINEKQQLHRAKSTENSRMILALTALGKDVTNVAGHNLLQGLCSMEYLQYQGINGPIWALIAFDSGNYPTPQGDVSREKLIDVILGAQLSDGGWALSGERSDPDMTGMALQALAAYVESRLDVKQAAERALKALSEAQNADGSFSSVDGPNSESLAQVITALAALGIDADEDARFVKNGSSAMDALLTYFIPGGGFRHVPDGNLDGMSTEQAYYALVAFGRMKQNRNFLYDMTDVIDAGGDVTTTQTTESLQLPTEPEMEQEEDTGRNILIWIGVMSACAALIGVLFLNRKRIFGKFL